MFTRSVRGLCVGGNLFVVHGADLYTLYTYLCAILFVCGVPVCCV